jgi:hypothetical protein
MALSRRIKDIALPKYPQVTIELGEADRKAIPVSSESTALVRFSE